MQRRKTTTTLLRQINRSAVVDLVRREGVVSPSSMATRLRISIPTVMRVVDDLIAEEIVEYDGFDESLRGRPPARVKFRGGGHAIIGIEAAKDKLYGAVADLNGRIQVEMDVAADDDGRQNLERLANLILALKRAPRPAGQTIRGIGVAVPSIVRQPQGLVVLTMGLGWSDLPLKQILNERFDEPVYIENDQNLAAVGEWGFGAGQKAQSLVCLVLGPGAGAGIMIDGKLYRGRSQAAGEINWYLTDPRLSGHAFPHLGDKQTLRFSGGVREEAIAALAAANRDYVAGRLSLDDLVNRAPADESLATVGELLDYSTMAVASISALINPDIIVVAGQIAQCAPLAIDALRKSLAGNVYDPPRLVLTELGHRAAAMGAIMMVLDATTLNPAGSLL